MTGAIETKPDLRERPRPAWRDSLAGYGAISRLNHWITAALFLGALGLGLFMTYGGLPREAIAPLMQWHKFLGVLVLVYGLWRVVWRARQGFPAPAARMPRWQERAAALVHAGLLTAILAMPVSGILMTLAGGRALAIWDVTLLPSAGKIEWLHTTAEAIHETAPPILLLLLALHIGAALKHHVIDRDTTLRRMITG